MQPVTDFLLNFGKKLGLESFTDEVGNVIIRKPATAGMENRKGVILQAHMDMVPQKNNDTVHDFEKDPIETYVDGDWLRARGTTLGADNGLGVCPYLPFWKTTPWNTVHWKHLSPKTKKPACTVHSVWKPAPCRAPFCWILIPKTKVELYIGCAGGMDVTASLEYKEVTPEKRRCSQSDFKRSQRRSFRFEINEGRANANKLLVRFLREAVASYETRLASWEGGNMRNAIPREAHAVVTIPAETKKNFWNWSNTVKTSLTKNIQLSKPQ